MMTDSIIQQNKQMKWICTLAVSFLLLAEVIVGRVDAASCNKGVMQIQSQREFINSDYPLSDCAAQTPLYESSSLLPVCGPAFEVKVVGSAMYLTPLANKEVVTLDGEDPPKKFACKLMNATAYFDTSDKQNASLTFYDDIGGGDNGAVASRLYTNKTDNTIVVFKQRSACPIKYKVTSGCILGVTASTPAPSCPEGTYVKGKYCMLCPPGSESTTPTSHKCQLCKKGYFNSYYGGNCKKCASGDYSSVEGANRCETCTQYAGNLDTVTQYTDGITCKVCPSGSARVNDNLVSNTGQCQACGGGKRCCTTNWSTSCPKCPPGFMPSDTAVTYGLVSASSKSCLETTTAVCSATMTYVIAKDCSITVVPGKSFAYTCSNATIFDAAVASDKLKATDVDSVSLASASGSESPFNTTSINGPFVTVKFLRDTTKKCTLKYRVTSVKGTDLGTTPRTCKPGRMGCVSTAGTCPAGSYVAQDGLGKYTVCLPCPTSQYTDVASSAKQCKKCPAGQSNEGFGNKGCKACPPGTYSNSKTFECTRCDYNFYSNKPGSKRCSQCPTGTFAAPTGEGSIGGTHCLLNGYGTQCCVEGDCKGKPSCPPGTLPRDEDYTAVFKVAEKSISAPECQQAPSLTCLQVGGLVSVTTNSQIFKARTINQPSCVPYYLQYTSSNEVTDYNKAEFTQGYDDNNGTYKVTTSPGDAKLIISFGPTCSAKLQLVAGYVLDLSPPAGTPTCPASGIKYKKGGRTFCKYCVEGYGLKNNKCVSCPEGTANELYAPSDVCKKCPVGQSASFSESTSCTQCSPGSVATTVGSKSCATCKEGSYSTDGIKCTACPTGTTAPAGSGFCYVPFPTK